MLFMPRAARSRPRLTRRRRVGIALTILVLTALGVGGAILWHRSTIAPAWYAPPVAADPLVQQTAETVEYRLVEEAHRARPVDDPWAVRITEEQINAWLAARLPEWAAHQSGVAWPDTIGAPQVRVTDAALTLSLPFGAPDARRYAMAEFRPAVVDDRLRLRLERVGVGDMWLPGAPVRFVMGRILAVAPDAFAEDPDVIAAINVISGDDDLDAVLELADDRVVRVRRIGLEDGAAVLVCDTQAGRDHAAAALDEELGRTARDESGNPPPPGPDTE